MTPCSIFAVAPNGHFVWANEIMASDAAALERARQLLDQLDLEVWSGGRKIAGLSARRRTPSLLTSWCEDSARAALSRLGHVGGAALTRPSFGTRGGLPPEPSLRLYGARWRVFRLRPVDAAVAKSISTRHSPPTARSID
jgi:hypothetical protein